MRRLVILSFWLILNQTPSPSRPFTRSKTYFGSVWVRTDPQREGADSLDRPYMIHDEARPKA
jgi:hypothetical protein